MEPPTPRGSHPQETERASEYVPNAIEDDNPNVSSEHSWPILFRSFVLLVCALTLLYWGIGAVSDSLADRVSLDTEREVFDLTKSSSSTTAQTKLVTLLEKLSSQEYPTQKISIHPVCSKEINAFALPGGHIQVTSELLSTLQNENAVLFTLAHELAHIKFRHPLKALGRKLTLFFVGSFFGVSGDQTLSWLAQGAGELGALQYSREQEEQADQFALEAILRIYGHLQGSDELFVLIEKKNRFHDWFPTFIRTHPDLENRIKKLRLHPGYTQLHGQLTQSPFVSEDLAHCDAQGFKKNKNSELPTPQQP